MAVRVSVVVPTYRRAALLDRCLDALAAQDLDPGAFEVIVADDAAEESTRSRVEGRAAHAFRYVAVAGSHGPAAARNAGWRAARAPIIAFTDDDTIPDPRWLAAGLAAFDRDPGLAAASGRVVVPLTGAPTDYGRNEAGLERAEFVTANCFVRRVALEAVGGFDERFEAAWREDSDLQFSLLARGFRIARVPGARVVHPVRPAGWGVSLKQQRKSQFNALLYKKHPMAYRERIQPCPPWRSYATVAALLAAAGGAVAGSAPVAWAGLAAWGVLTLRFCASRLRHASKRPAHVLEMAVTSALIPPLSVFWRLYGAVRFRVLFL